MKEPTKETEEVPQGGKKRTNGCGGLEAKWIFFFIREEGMINYESNVAKDLSEMNIVFLGRTLRMIKSSHPQEEVLVEGFHFS